jgi:AraC family transcriptional regulator, melibiose operon regulatory protein
MPSRSEVLTEPPVGLAVWHGTAAPMATGHRHDDVELNLSPAGALVYELGGHTITIPSGHLVAFWGAVPHRLVACPPETELHWATVPIAVLGHAGHPLLDRLLGPTPLVAPAGPSTGATVDRLRTWHEDLASGSRERRDVVGLELEAALRRLAMHDLSSADAAPVPIAPHRDRALAIARLLLERHAEPLTVAEVSAAVSVHPHHAMELFRAAMGTTIVRYLTQIRVAAAQRLLLTTDEPVAVVGARAGFGSQSQFYAQFTRSCGVPPGTYRRRRGEP